MPIYQTYFYVPARERVRAQGEEHCRHNYLAVQFSGQEERGHGQLRRWLFLLDCLPFLPLVDKIFWLVRCKQQAKDLSSCQPDPAVRMPQVRLDMA